MLLNNILFFLLSATFLILSGIVLVRSLTKMARFLRISEFTSAFIIMAVATSLPELFVGISSALQGNPALSLGNVVGANIIDLTIITGIFVLLGRGIRIDTHKVGRDVYFMLLSIILVIVLFFIGRSLSRFDGLILVALFGFNLFRMLRKRKNYPAKFVDGRIKRWEIIFNTLLFVFALAVLFVSSHFATQYATLIAIDLDLPQIIVGLFLISIATTLPELVFGIEAIMMGHKSMVIGDQTGTVFTNICLVLGLAAIIHPITAEYFSFLVAGIFMFISAFMFTAFVQSGKRLDILEGLGLVMLYVAFAIIEFFVK
ncbi:MAG: sodium:calcium antiporter [archaeon]